MSVSYKFRDPLPPPPDRSKERVETTVRTARAVGFGLVWIATWAVMGGAFALVQMIRCFKVPPSPDGLLGLGYFLFALAAIVLTVIVQAAFALGMAAPASLVHPPSRRRSVLIQSFAPEALIGVVTGLGGWNTALVTLPLGVALTCVLAFVLVTTSLSKKGLTTPSADPTGMDTAKSPRPHGIDQPAAIQPARPPDESV